MIYFWQMLKTFAVCIFGFAVFSVAHAQSVSDSIHLQKAFFFQPPKLSLPSTVTVIPKNFTTQHLPFFCNKEWKFEKATKIPFRFRLGSVEYCDQMEGKHK